MSTQDHQHADSGGRKRLIVIGLIVGVVIVIAIIASCAGRGGSYRCGDYDRVGGRYVSKPNRGDYVKEGNDYRYVGCDRSRGGGVWFGGSRRGSNYGPGSDNRGGGSGTGK